nr:hypothetical protein [Pseudomonas sp. B11D7D]
MIGCLTKKPAFSAGFFMRGVSGVARKMRHFLRSPPMLADFV